jgi:UDPglucose--hexose-1-phosphate uridylyltransferase
MREIRTDPTTGDEVVISTDRVRRPQHLALSLEARGLDAPCPFCPGNEHLTPVSLAQHGSGSDWEVRAFPNRFPALGIEGSLERRAKGPYERVSGIGAHEVIVESSAHGVPAWARPEGSAHALRIARDRMRDLARDARFRQLTWFRNCGAAAGASLAHPHAQVVATPVIPAIQRRIVERARHHRLACDRDLMQDLLDYDLEERARVLFEDDDFVALCPWAPRAPFEVWIVPNRSAPSFLDEDDRGVNRLARALDRVHRAHAQVLETPPYNACLYTAPQDRSLAVGFRWHLRILPRIAGLAGFELGVGAAMHGVLPEQSADWLRSAMGAG